MNKKTIKEWSEIFYHRRKNPSDYFELTFQMTTECNFRCTYCYETKYPSSLQLEDAYSVIDKLFDIEDNKEWWNGFLLGNTTKNTIEFNFFGGECFLEVKKMEAICDYFLKRCNEDPIKYAKRIKNFKIICQTNGYLLKTKASQHFLDKYIDNMQAIFITIDGSKEFHDKCRVLKDSGEGTWQVVHDNIMWFRSQYPKCSIQTKGTIGPDTIGLLYESFLAYFDSGFQSAKITLRTDCEWSKESVETAKEQFKKIVDYCLEHPTNYKYHYLYSTFGNNDEFRNGERDCTRIGTCHSNGTGMCLTTNGDIYVCFNFSPLSIPKELNREDFKLGSIKEGITNEGLTRNEKILGCVDESIYNSEKCTSCVVKHTCEFCPATAYKQTGDVNKNIKYDCEVRKVEQTYASLFKYLRNKRKDYFYDKNDRLVRVNKIEPKE